MLVSVDCEELAADVLSLWYFCWAAEFGKQEFGKQEFGNQGARVSGR